MVGLGQGLQQLGQGPLTLVGLYQSRSDQAGQRRSVGKALLHVIEDHAIEQCCVNGRLTRAQAAHGQTNAALAAALPTRKQQRGAHAQTARFKAWAARSAWPAARCRG